jgi:hypothetical protein
MEMISTNKDNKVYAYYREKDENRVVVFLNLSKKNLIIKPDMKKIFGDYKNYFTGEKTTLSLSDSLRLEPWGYRVYVR